ncbi:SagB/ThcOx family dehydrogenase [Methanosalsum zhilinae]|nr:SagB/ThcOx family dehydrogenase [Methanosalsum zhilinae]
MVWIRKSTVAKIMALIVFMVAVGMTAIWPKSDSQNSLPDSSEVIMLPEPALKGDVSVEEAIDKRRSIRSFTDGPLAAEDISQIMWAAQGITDETRMFRSAPSAGATYPLEVYIVTGSDGVGDEDIPVGVYRYNPAEHSLQLVYTGDVRQDLYSAALRQSPIDTAPVNIIIAADYSRTTGRYGDRGIMYVHMEAGHSAQNLYLQTAAMDLGMVVIGAFEDDAIKRILSMPASHDPLYIIPVGHPR